MTPVHATQLALQQIVEMWNARRHSLRSRPARSLMESTAAERYPLGGSAGSEQQSSVQVARHRCGMSKGEQDARRRSVLDL